MANRYGPQIVTNGLVLCLDAGNSKSYPGSGTNAYNLSGNNQTILLANGASVIDGNFVFDGTNDYISTLPGEAFYQYTTNITICAWFKRSGNLVGGTGGGQSTQNVDSWSSTNVWLFHGNNVNNTIIIYINAINNGVAYSITKVTPTLLDNTWYHICATCNNSVMTLYMNGKQSGSTTAGITSGTIINNNNSVIQYGKDPRFASGRFFTGSIGPNQVYNRSLSSFEISQNYNALKGRFGL